MAQLPTPVVNSSQTGNQMGLPAAYFAGMLNAEMSGASGIDHASASLYRTPSRIEIGHRASVSLSDYGKNKPEEPARRLSNQKETNDE